MDRPPSALVTTASDEELLVAAARREPGAVATLYERHVDPVYRFCLRRLGNHEAAEDATAQVFTKAIAALPAFRGGVFQGWLFSIAHRVILDRARGERAALPLESANAVADPRPGPEDVVLRADAARNIRSLLGQLSEGQRQVIELRLAGLRGAEIAEVLCRSHGTVRNLQHQALVRLRELYDRSSDVRKGG